MGWDREIVKVGNSLGVRIPSKVFRKTTFKEGDAVDVRIQDDDTLVLERKEP